MKTANHPPVHGRVRLIGNQLTITVIRKSGRQVTETYTVSRSERTIGLTKVDGSFYDVSFDQVDEPRCSCGDLTFRDREDGECKHLKALRFWGLIRGKQ
jgi:hypothetical protein